jgi:HEAT repeat protein
LLNTNQNEPGKSRVIDSLGSLLDSGDEVDRCYACKTLGVLGDSRVTDKLAQRLRDEDIDVCIDAAEALGRLGEAESIGVLVESMYKDPDGEVKVAVVEALGQIGFQTGSEEVNTPLLNIAAQRPDDMIIDESDTWDCWWDMQLKAIEALGRMQTKEAVPVLQAILNDEEGQDIESEVLKVLAIIGIEGEEVLRQRLVDGTARQRRRAAKALGYTNSKAAVTALTTALQDQDHDVRIAGVEALQECKAVEPLAAILLSQQDYDAEVCSAAIIAIQHLGTFDELSLEQLTKLLTNDNNAVRQSALAALSTRSDNPVGEILDIVISAVDDPDSDIVIAACDTLARIQNESTQQLLINLLTVDERQPEIRAHAAHCLGQLGIWNADTATCLEKTVIDDGAKVRLATLNALLELANSRADKIHSQPEDKEIKSPLQIIISALNGDIKPPASAKIIPIIPVDDANRDIPPEVVDDPLKDESSYQLSNQDGAMSTVEAITRANVEMTLAASVPLEEAVITAKTNEAYQDNEDIHEYEEIIEEHNKTADWLFAKENKEATEDARCLAAAVLAKYSADNNDIEKVISALMAVVDEKDTKLGWEAIESASLIISRNPEFELSDDHIAVLMQKLVTGERNIQIACARAIACTGKESVIDPLFKCMETKDVSIQVNAIYSLTELFISLLRVNQSEYADKATTLVKRFMSYLDDKESGVRIAAIKGLPKLLNSLGQNEAKENLIDETIENIIQSSVFKDGNQARAMGKVLQQIAPEQSSMKLLKLLDSQIRSVERRFVIEMLEEIYA